MALIIGNKKVTPKVMARQLIFNTISNLAADVKDEPYMEDASERQTEEVTRFIEQELDRMRKKNWNLEKED